MQKVKQDFAKKYLHTHLTRFRPNLFTLFYMVSIFINLYLRYETPVRAAFLSGHDDQLGVELSSNILNGQWLGPWNNRTLAKPPGYSLYLTFAHFIPVPFAVLNQILYILVVILLIKKIQKIFISNFKYQKIVIFIVFNYLIFQPILFFPEANRIYRSSVPIQTLTLLYSVLLWRLFDQINNTSELTNFTTFKKLSAYVNIVGLAMTYSLMVLFRFESFWILICSLPLIILKMLLKIYELRNNKIARREFLRFIMPLPIVAILFYSIPVFAIQESNRSTYGVPLTENYYQGDFAEAINLWASVDVGRDPRAYVVVSAAQRNAVYGISKNASLMQPFLESKENGWNKPACDLLKMCDNSGAWFPWQLRDAAVQTGLVYSERSFQSFFQAIAGDIEKACKKSNFKCKAKSSLVGSKPLTELPRDRILQYSILNLKVLVPTNVPPSQPLTKTDNYGAPVDVVNLFHSVVNYQPTDFYSEQKLQTISNITNKLNSFYIPLNLIIYFLAFLGIILTFFRKSKTSLRIPVAFLLVGLISQLVGTSVAQVSIGSSPGSVLYLLQAYPLLQMLSVIGIISLPTQRFKMKR